MTTEQISTIKTIEPERINAISVGVAGLEIEFSEDNGATETVAPDSMPTSMQTALGATSRKWVQYEAANGATIRFEEGKRFNAFTKEG